MSVAAWAYLSIHVPLGIVYLSDFIIPIRRFAIVPACIKSIFQPVFSREVGKSLEMSFTAKMNIAKTRAAFLCAIAGIATEGTQRNKRYLHPKLDQRAQARWHLMLDAPSTGLLMVAVTVLTFTLSSAHIASLRLINH
jgi:hypothetical protein